MTSPSVLFVLPDVSTPSLGVRNTWRTAELLASEGVDAAVWHYSAGFRPSWFESSAPVVHGAELELADDHVLVIPEVLVLKGHDPAPGARIVIFNQDLLATYDNIGPADPYPGWRSKPIVWSSTEVAAGLLSRLLPDVDVSVAPSWVDPDQFRPRSLQATRRIAYSSGGRTREETVAVALLHNEPLLTGWQLVSVDGMTDDERADALGSSDVFIALGGDRVPEGAVAEALASGCYLVAFGGSATSYGGLLDPRWCRTVAVGDVRSLVDAVAGAAHAIERGELRADALAARETVADRYRRSAVARRLTELVAHARKAPAAPNVRAEHPLAFFERHQLPTTFDLQTAINELREQTRHLLEITASIPELRKRYGEALATISGLREEIDVMRAEVLDAEHVTVAAQEMAARLRLLDGLSHRIRDLEESTSWRITAPLRLVSGVVFRR